MKKVIFIILYWFLSLTWGSIMSVLGIIVSFVMLIFKGNFHKNGCTIIVEVGSNWGGLSLGCISFCGKYTEIDPDYYQHVRRHEFGHSLQNIILGPFFIFIVAFPSLIRCCYYMIQLNKGKNFEDTWYDSIWFEHTATKYGTTMIDYIEKR